LVDDLAKINNDGWVDGNLGVNQAISGLLRLGKRVFLTDGTVIAGQRVKLGDETSVYDVSAVSLFRGITSIVRGSFDVAVLPLRVPFCELPVFACTPGNDVTVADATTIALTPGSYGALVVGNGATLTLDPNADYTFCSIRIGRGSLVESLDRTTINVVGDVSIGAGSKVWTPPVVNDLPLILNVGGTKIKISQFAILEAAITAPLAKLKMQRQAQIYGCFCTDTLTTDKEVLLECVDTTGGP
jgi:carbonic anhydrase/acetyltransferase-like protein (isoleucine patch superfamily)